MKEITRTSKKRNIYKKHWKMRTIVKILDIFRVGNKLYNRFLLSCNHTETLQRSKNVKYIVNHTKTRCYQCVSYK